MAASVALSRRAFAALAASLAAAGAAVYGLLYYYLTPEAAVVGSSVYTAVVALAAFLVFLEAIRITGVQAVLGILFTALALHLLVSGVIGTLVIDIVEVVVGAERYFQQATLVEAYWPASLAVGVYMFGYTFLLIFALVLYSNSRDLGVSIPPASTMTASVAAPLAVLAFSVVVAAASAPLLPRKPLSVTYTALVALEFSALAVIAPLLLARYETGIIEDILRLVVSSIALLIVANYMMLISNIVPLGDYYVVKGAGVALRVLSYALLLRAGLLASALAKAVL